jgi:endonuclease YncB( thermonuclease family)
VGRVYGIVVVDGEDLNETLVANGLARIYGTRTALFDGRDSRAYLLHLKEMESKAKDARRGGWKTAE